MSFKMKFQLTPMYLTNEINRQKIKAPKRVFTVVHDTGNKNSTARNNYNYMNRKYKIIKGVRYELDGKTKFRVASAHTFTDDKEILVLVPFDEKAWHVLYDIPLDNHIFGDDANDIALGYELCYFNDINRTKKAYEKFVWLNAYTCYLYGWKDSKRRMVGHDFLDPKRKTDPMNAFKLLGITFDDFLNDVVAEYQDCTKIEIVKPVPDKGGCKLDELEKWQKELGEKAIDVLAADDLMSNPEDWKKKLDEHVPNWLFFEMMKRIAEKK